MDAIISLVGSVASNVIAGVILYYVYKALDNNESNKKDEQKGNKNEG